MKPKTILTTTKFVLWMQELAIDEIEQLLGKQYHLRLPITYENYAKLMATPLSFEMFVLCNESKKPIKDPSKIHYSNVNYVYSSDYRYDLKQYQQAKEKVLFEGYKHKDGIVINKEEMQQFAIRGTIEQLIENVAVVPNDNFWAKIGL